MKYAIYYAGPKDESFHSVFPDWATAYRELSDLIDVVWPATRNTLQMELKLPERATPGSTFGLHDGAHSFSLSVAAAKA